MGSWAPIRTNPPGSRVSGSSRKGGRLVSSSVRSERAGPVTTIVLDRPHTRNAIDRETSAALLEAFLSFDRDPASDVAVLWGAGGAFCSGADLKYVAGAGVNGWLDDLRLSPPVGAEELPPGPLGPTHLSLRKPVIAAVSGPAVAGGLELALWCDLRIAEPSAYFGVFSRRWGVPLLDGGTVRLPRLIGEGRALDMILTGRIVGAEEALHMGLCQRLAAEGAARQEAEDLAHRIARFPQHCLRTDRSAVLRQSGLPLREALRQEFAQGLDALEREGLEGARRFAAGHGRHGDPV
jgi:enoyl-CoA hydratase